jgi:hypothetical protein
MREITRIEADLRRASGEKIRELPPPKPSNVEAAVVQALQNLTTIQARAVEAQMQINEQLLKTPEPPSVTVNNSQAKRWVFDVKRDSSGRLEQIIATAK